jgi:hypothetical protein
VEGGGFPETGALCTHGHLLATGHVIYRKLKCSLLFSNCVLEIARDALHHTGLFTVVGGIISPVNDSYEKKVT